MRAIILDNKLRFKEKIDGAYKNNQIEYMEDQSTIWLICGLINFVTNKLKGREKKTLPCDYNLVQDIGDKQKFAFYKFDGKNNMQLSLEEIKGEYNTADYIEHFKLWELQKQQVLTKPFDAKQILEYLTLFLLIACTLAVWYVTTNGYSMLSKQYNSTVQIAQQNTHLIQLLNNQTSQLIKIYNQTYIYMRSHNP